MPLPNDSVPSLGSLDPRQPFFYGLPPRTNDHHLEVSWSSSGGWTEADGDLADEVEVVALYPRLLLGAVVFRACVPPCVFEILEKRGESLDTLSAYTERLNSLN
jgi:hypothetical protein